MATRCEKCGILKPHFARGMSADNVEYQDSGKCIYCRHAKRPSAQVHGMSALKELLWSMNRRKKPKEVKA